MKAPAIRIARREDRPAILAVIEEAFGDVEEVELVERIWTFGSYDSELELVAELDGQVVGHALFSIGRLNDAVPVPALAPLSVHPDHQNCGIGTALVVEGLRRCQQQGHPLVIVTGHWDYYPRFGFEPALPLGIEPSNPEEFPDLRAFMACRLERYDGQSGLYRYSWELSNDVTVDLAHAAFPRASTYDSDWLLDLDMGPNPLWLLEELLDRMTIDPGMRILDLGCGKGATSVFLASEFDVEVWAVDLWVPAERIRSIVDHAGLSEAVHVINADVRALPFDNSFFDVIVSIDAWEYFGTDDHLLPSLLRVLRPGGRIGVATPAMRHDVRDLGHIPGHIRDVVGWEALAWHPPDWWSQQWELTGLVTNVQAREAATGWADWLRWSQTVATRKSSNDSVVDMLTADNGGLLTFALVTATKLKEPRLRGVPARSPAELHRHAPPSPIPECGRTENRPQPPGMPAKWDGRGVTKDRREASPTARS